MSERRLTPRGAERRAQLIAYATERFAADGYHPTSVADIVDAESLAAVREAKKAAKAAAKAR